MRRKALFVIGLGLGAAACGNDVAPAVESTAPTTSASAEVEPAAPVIPEDFTGLPDRSIAIVELEDVHFDTFNGGSIPLSEATDEQIVSLLDRIPPIDNPPYINPAEDEWLGDQDPVLGYVTADGQPIAYPHKILNFHEIVNDDLAGVPVLVSYCPLCNSGVVYDRRLDDLRQDGELTFSNTSALFDNDLVMIDRQTSTYWWQVPGRGIVGTLAGAELTVLASVTTTWAQWQEDYPDTLILSRDLGFTIDYTRDPFVGYAERVNDGFTPFPVDPVALADSRLPAATQVVAIEAGGEAVAVPVEALTGDFELEVGGDSFVVAPDGAGGASVFALDPDGARTPAPSRSTFWFAYVASFPDARVASP